MGFPGIPTAMYNNPQLREMMLREDARPPLKICHARLNFDVLARITRHLEGHPELVETICAMMEREDWKVNQYIIGLYGYKLKVDNPALNAAWDAMMDELGPRGQGTPVDQPAHPTVN